MRVLRFSLTVLAVMACAMTSHAQSIGVNFGADNAGGTGAGGDGLLLAADEAGVVRQSNWNNALDIGGTLNDVVDNTGAASTMDVTWAAGESWNWDTTQGSTDAKLMSSWVSVNTIGDALTVDVSQIPYTNYDFYLYTGHDRDSNPMTVSETNGAFADFTTIEDVTGDTLAGATFDYVDGTNGTGNYAKISNLTASSLNLSFVGTTDRLAVSGIQIVQSTGTAVPEPTSFALLGAFGLAGLARRRRS